MIPPEVWKTEICNGLDATLVARTLSERGMLQRAGDGFQPVRKIDGARYSTGAAMKADLASKLHIAMGGEITPETGVVGVTGVAGVSATYTKSLKLQWLRPLRLKTDKVAKDVNRGVVGDVAAPPEPDQAELDERKALAMHSLPEPYLDAWARLQMPKADAGFGCGMAASHRHW
jgi:hypothetical protein